MKLLIGGSPCTFWSIAQNAESRETKAEGLGWELFLNYVIAIKKYKPDYFIYENNKSMSKEIMTQITDELGVEPILINSSLVSAQNRQRLYWVGERCQDGTYSKVDVKQPEDLGILLRDVLDDGSIAWQEKGHAITTRTSGAIPSDTLTKHRHTMVADRVVEKLENGGSVCSINGKPVEIVSNNENNSSEKIYAKPVRLGVIGSDSQGNRVYSVNGKSVTQTAQGGGLGSNTGLYAVPTEEKMKEMDRVYVVSNKEIDINNKKYAINLPDGCYVIRKLSVEECKRLQTVPEEFSFPVSNSQAYKMLGNGWTVDVIKHILLHFDGILGEELDVLAMYDGMSCGQIALNKLGANVCRYIATEIDKYAIKTTQHNYPNTIQMGDAFQVRDDNSQLSKQLCQISVDNHT